MDVDSFPGQLARTQRFSLGVPHAFTLSPDGARVLFLRTRGPEDGVGCLWLLDGGQERLLVDPDGLTAAAGDTGSVPEAELLRRERARERGTGIMGYAVDAAVRTVVFALDGGLWVLALEGTDDGADGTRDAEEILTADSTRGVDGTAGADGAGAAARRVPTPGPVVDPRVSPDGRRVAYVSDGDLHVVELEDAAGEGQPAADAGPRAGTGRILSDLGDTEKPDVSWGLPEHAASESMHRARGYWWSPDGTRLLAARVDVARVQRWWISDPSDPTRAPREIPYPVAGTANADVSLYVLGLDGSRVEVVWDRAAFEYVAAVDWDEHGPLVTVQSRDQRTLRVLGLDPDSGATTILHEQCDEYWVSLVPGTPARTESGVLVHCEDRGNTRSLTVGGRPVTPDGLQLLEVVAVDGESVVFVAGDEPTEEHLWLYEDGQLRRLSDGPGVHSGQRVGGTTLVTSFTDAGRRVRVLRDADAAAGGTVAGAAAASETSDGDAADGVPVRDLSAVPDVLPRPIWLRLGERELRAVLLLPSWYRPGEQRLPVLLCPYGGPAARLVLHARHAHFCESQWFAEGGFAVLVADGRGTPGRGPEWERTVYGNKLDFPLEDQVIALHEVAKQYPDLDLGRVAMRGWSYGGALSAAAVLRRPDVFHAGVAGAPSIDPSLYDTHWTERFLGHPDENPEAYQRSTLIPDAPKLRRPLLLEHGLADDNVVPAHSLRLSAALLAAGRPHQVLPLTASTHMPAAEAMASLPQFELDFLREALGMAEA